MEGLETFFDKPDHMGWWTKTWKAVQRYKVTVTYLLLASTISVIVSFTEPVRSGMS